MAWRGSVGTVDRIFATLVYIMPLYYGLPFGLDLVAQFPVLQYLIIITLPLAYLNSAIPFGGFILFIILFAAVVRNTKLSHFIRYNTLQAILLDILIILVGLVLNLLSQTIGMNLITQTLNHSLFLAVVAVSLYSMIQSILGRYSELPMVSEIAYNQVR